MTESKSTLKYCDLVMKGGVTSGVVYPLAVQKLASEYWFKNIGGTSAGAIAAGLTAAAECLRRRTGTAEGFAQVAELPGQLARDGFLLALFQPDPTTKRTFEVLLAGMSAKQANRSVWIAVIWKLILNFSSSFAIATLVPAVICALLGFWLKGSWIPYVLIALLGSVILVPCLVLRRAVTEAVTALLKNWFGFCSGFDPKSALGRAPLTNWLYSLLNEISGQKPGVPLTFGDLWDAPSYEGEDPKGAELRCVEQVQRSINLEVMTTNLTLGCPSRIPFDTKGLHFSPGECAEFFPAEVVDWMVNHQASSERTVLSTTGEMLPSLPAMHDLPIIVAIRMSLSFPILLCAVPLYSVDYSLDKNNKQPKSKPVVAERCWFSDGGISSNFPIHFFDSPLPRWPTFGIDLKSPHPDHNNENEYVWLPLENGQGILPTWNRFDSHGLFGFAGAILNVMQNWRDNLQMVIPGYRDRIVHISHTEREGGLNLRMDAAIIEKMSNRGRRAGEALLNQFDWNNHAWIRYRSTMCCWETSFEKFGNSYRNPLPQDAEIWKAIYGNGKPPCYPWRSGQEGWAPEAARELASLSAGWLQGKECFCDGAPRPRPETRISPKV
jgi:predicted acylesterase/phospholipase RssA